MRTNTKTLLFLLLSGVMFLSFSNLMAQDKDKDADKQKKIEKQRQKFDQNRSNALKELYKAIPEARSQVEGAYAYAGFANTGVNLFLLSSGNGGGKAHNNQNGQEVYVKMISVGAGVGIGYKKYFAIFIFENKAAYDNFLENGWSADGQADATADTGNEGEGGSASAALTVADGVQLYQIADKGLALQATVQGTKFVVADELNGN